MSRHLLSARLSQIAATAKVMPSPITESLPSFRRNRETRRAFPHAPRGNTRSLCRQSWRRRAFWRVRERSRPAPSLPSHGAWRTDLTRRFAETSPR